MCMQTPSGLSAQNDRTLHTSCKTVTHLCPCEGSSPILASSSSFCFCFSSNHLRLAPTLSSFSPGFCKQTDAAQVRQCNTCVYMQCMLALKPFVLGTHTVLLLSRVLKGESVQNMQFECVSARRVCAHNTGREVCGAFRHTHSHTHISTYTRKYTPHTFSRFFSAIASFNHRILVGLPALPQLHLTYTTTHTCTHVHKHTFSRFFSAITAFWFAFLHCPSFACSSYSFRCREDILDSASSSISSSPSSSTAAAACPLGPAASACTKTQTHGIGTMHDCLA